MGGSKTTTSEAEIPEELKPLFSALVENLLTPIEFSGDILREATSPTGQFAKPKVTPIESMFQRLVKDRTNLALNRDLFSPQPVPETPNVGLARTLGLVGLGRAAFNPIQTTTAQQQLRDTPLPQRTAPLPLFSSLIDRQQRLNAPPPRL